jgi:hypothetical protein
MAYKNLNDNSMIATEGGKREEEEGVEEKGEGRGREEGRSREDLI